MPADRVTIPIDDRPRWLAITPDGRRVFATVDDVKPDGSSIGAVAVIDSATNRLLSTIVVGGGAGGPSGVAITPDGRHVYVPNWDAGRMSGIVSVIDSGSNTVTATVVISGRGGGPSGVAISPDGRQAYVATHQEVGEESGRVSVIDTESNSVIARVAVNPFPSGIAVTPDGGRAYVLDEAGMPAVIDTATHEATFPIDGLGTGRIAFTPDGLRAYVTQEGSLTVHVLDTGSNALIGLIDLDGRPTDVALSPDGARAYVTQRTGSNLCVIDTKTNMPSDPPLKWPGTADGIALTPGGANAYVSDRQSRAVLVLPVLPPIDAAGPRPTE